MVAARVWHALDDVAAIRAGQAGDVHLDAADEAQAARALVVCVRTGNGFGKLG